MQFISAIAGLCVALLLGSMAFFSAVMAPLVFTKLDAATAGRFIREVFPWYYLVMLSLAAIAAATLAPHHSLEASVMTAVAVGAWVSRRC